MRNFIILSTSVFLLFYSNLAIAQSSSSVSAAIDQLSATESIIFDSKSRKEKKLFKKWMAYPQISKVTISGTYDSLKLEKLIKEIAKNENIDEVSISVSNRYNLPLTLSTLTNLTSLKIYNSPNLNQEKILVSLSGLAQLSAFSWINNNAVLQIDLSTFLPNLKTIELIDSSLKNVLNPENTIFKLKNLENLTLSVASINDILLNQNEITSLTKICLIDINKYQSEESTPDFLDIENDLSVKFYVINDKSILVEYFGNTSVLPEKIKIQIQNKLGGIHILDWDEKGYTNSEKTITRAKPVEIIENDLSQNFEHKNPAVVPPIKNLVIPKSIYTIESTKTTQITRENGTTIDIPSDAFMDKNGNEVNGNITVSYKEYMDPLTIFASGIPMTYDSGGVKNTFTSAGMFELYAFSDKEELQLKPGKNIKVEFASINDGSNFNFYQFDEANKEWTYQSAAANIKPIDTITMANYNNRMAQINSTKRFTQANYNFDTTCFENRFNDLNYFNLFDNSKKTGRVNYCEYYEVVNGRVKRCRFESYKRTAISNMFKITRVPKSDSDSIKHVLFTLSNEKMLVWFPELKIFYGYIFYAEDFEKYRLLKEHYFKDKIYSDVRIEYEKGDEYCTFVMKSSTGFVRLKANILDVNKTKQLPYVYKSFNRRYLNYKKRLTIRQKAMDMQLTIKKSNFLNREMQRNFSSSRISYTNSNNRRSLGSISVSVLWTFPINVLRVVPVILTLGLVNCDHVFMPRPRPTAPTYHLNLNLKDDKDSSIKIHKLFLFDSELNGYFTYDSSNVSIRPKTTMGIIASTAAGVLYYVSKSSLLKKDFTKKEVDIQMNESGESLRTIDDLARIFRR